MAHTAALSVRIDASAVDGERLTAMQVAVREATNAARTASKTITWTAIEWRKTNAPEWRGGAAGEQDGDDDDDYENQAQHESQGVLASSSVLPAVVVSMSYLDCTRGHIFSRHFLSFRVRDVLALRVFAVGLVRELRIPGVRRNVKVSSTFTSTSRANGDR